MKITHSRDYAEQRRKAYPSIADQLDALWKLVGAMPVAQRATVQDMLDKVAAVKARYPKK